MSTLDTLNERVTTVAGVELHAINIETTCEMILELLRRGGSGYVVTMNVDHAVMLRTDNDFKRAYDGAFLRVADGAPIAVLGRLAKPSIESRVTGADLLPRLCQRLAEINGSIYIIGGQPGAAVAAARQLQHRFPGLVIAGTSCPEYGFESDQELANYELDLIRVAQPDVVVAALGTPKQEKLMALWSPLLDECVAICVGAAIDFASGRVRRSPKLIQRLGLEWIYRVAMEPRRLWKRYLVRDLAFVELIVHDLAAWMSRIFRSRSMVRK